ncbi:hypothetical protein DFH94DRAFT_681436 [Russula ochroleuca]|uniref:Uncharacterized protein n=1 Tax=Russula ochroleuca TaxID=152965 RepID=A0A9P5MWR7_9AGAM|nr:hypothetical protein DFH94DRAFT_681436 [Russula ochroleuca]
MHICICTIPIPVLGVLPVADKNPCMWDITQIPPQELVLSGQTSIAGIDAVQQHTPDHVEIHNQVLEALVNAAVKSINMMWQGRLLTLCKQEPEALVNAGGENENKMMGGIDTVLHAPSPPLATPNIRLLSLSVADLGRGGSEACRDTELTERVWRDRDCSGDSGRSSVMESVQACQEMRQGASNKCESNLCGASGQEQADHHGQDQYAILHTPPPRPHDPPWHSTGNC